MEYFRVYPAVVVAWGDQLGVAMTVDAPVEPHPEAARLAIKAYKGEEPHAPSDPLVASLFYATVYGGVVLIHKREPITAIARLLPSIKVSLEACNPREAPQNTVSDAVILRAWALIASGSEEEGLRALSGGCLVWPPRYRLRVGQGSPVPPIGVRVIPDNTLEWLEE